MNCNTTSRSHLRGARDLALRCLPATVACALLAQVGLGQTGFGPQEVISFDADGSWAVFSADLDGDGDLDVLSASRDDDKIAWYENVGAGSGVGGGSFGPQRIITSSADDAWDVCAADLDGDGDADVLSASYNDNLIAWYETTGPGPSVSRG
ncbi:MAG: hypothetical protein CMJ84_11115 [Planctomycetes bacterium]|nr:hypothetical protein [Planctomycetota bacterium]MDP6409224.1 FG-GAP-like repeat-containing protein [Planctomycetota bacterium]